MAHGGSGHEIGGGAHSAGYDHSGVFGHGNNAFGHAFDLGHMAAMIGSHMGFGHPGRASVGHVGRAPGAVHPQASWSYGSLGALDPMPVNVSEHGTGIQVRLPGVVFGASGVQLLVWPHGHINTQLLFRRIAARYGLVSLSRRAHGINCSRKDHNELLDTKTFDGPGQTSLPSASFPGATGNTTVWNEFYQAPSKKGWFSNNDIDVGPPLPPHIAITGFDWCFDQTGDYETRIAITVANTQTCISGEWVPINQESARRHIELAVKIALDLYVEIAKVKPKTYSTIMREIQAKSNVVTATAPAPCLAEDDTCSASEIHNGPGPAPHLVSNHRHVRGDLTDITGPEMTE